LIGQKEDMEHCRLYIFTEFVAGGSVGALIKTYGALPETVRRRRRRPQEGPSSSALFSVPFFVE
jgi:hypothetical protein